MKTLTFAINKEDGQVYSRMDSEVAVPILQYDKIGEDGNFNAPLQYKLEKVRVTQLVHDEWVNLVWTKKIPLEIKNRHREFWGLKPLKPAAKAKLTSRQRMVYNAIFYTDDKAMSSADVGNVLGRKPKWAIPFMHQLVAKGLLVPSYPASCAEDCATAMYAIAEVEDD